MNDPHARFSAWLLAGARGEPPRDLALHASVCPECTRAIAAIDLLSQIDTGRAKMPFWEGADEEPGGLVRAGRFAAAASGVMLIAVVTGIGVSQLIANTRGPGGVGLSSGTPQQGVLGGSGTPAASPDTGKAPASSPTPTASPSDEPFGTPFTNPTARPTPRPTALATSTPKPSPTPSGTPLPTPLPSASASASASTSASASASGSASSSASASASGSASSSASASASATP
jgi:hypothetical protein